MEGTLDRRMGPYRIIPKIAWNFDALRRTSQPRLENLSFELFLDGLSCGKQVVTVQVRRGNDCPLSFAGDTDELDTGWMMATYVNEDHPWIEDKSWESFCAAIEEGEEAFRKIRKSLALRQPEFLMIDVAAARHSGIMPIPSAR